MANAGRREGDTYVADQGRVTRRLTRVKLAGTIIGDLSAFKSL